MQEARDNGGEASLETQARLLSLRDSRDRTMSRLIIVASRHAWDVPAFDEPTRKDDENADIISDGAKELSRVAHPHPHRAVARILPRQRDFRARSAGASSARCGTSCCVARHCPTTRQARRSDTRSTAMTCTTASRRWAGLRSFPLPPPLRWPCPTTEPRRASSSARALAPDSSTPSPGPRGGRHTRASSDRRSAP